ncbi:MAG: Ig-like domain-containing protein [Oscillospiraceae bacterium]|nr:Ig-like domain-containing protein [Oscillospiraceae bacterium]
MEKVICDVCGTDYPETAAQCPICGCARGDGGQTSAGNTAAAEEDRPAYTYTKGGRFSKSNVRKRLKAAQIQQVPEPEPEDDPDYDDYDEDEDDEQDEPASNRGLIVIVILLLLAIIAVSSYIAIVHFDLLGNDDPTVPMGSTGTSQSTVPSTTPGGVQVPCTNLTVTDSEITLRTLDSVWQLSYAVEPLDTTDQIRFVSDNESVATVDASGRVTAVGSGEATITITCGAYVSECRVVCDLNNGSDDPSDPTTPSDPVVTVELKLNRTDFTLSSKGSSWNLYSGDLDPAEITWTSNNEDVVTVTNGKVVAVGTGRTQVVAEYQGQKVSCWVSCRWTEETEPAPTDPTDPGEEPAEVYTLMINGSISPYGDEENAEVTLHIGDFFTITVENEMGARMDVTWTMSKDGICTMNDRKVTGAAAGKVTLTTSYGDQTFTCVIIVKE